MKRIIIPFSLCLLLAACGDKTDSAQQDTQADSMTTMQENAPASTAADIPAGLKSDMDKMMAQLKGYQPTGDADHDFAAIMRIHHQGALAMMQTYMPGANDEMLKNMAESGITKQQGEISGLDAFLDGHQAAKQQGSYGKDAIQMIMDMMKMETMPADADKAFAMMMVPHHESAVHISQMYLNEGKDATLKAMAKKIATDQQKEADELKKWVAAHP